jgi:hypothetical protein
MGREIWDYGGLERSKVKGFEHLRIGGVYRVSYRSDYTWDRLYGGGRLYSREVVISGQVGLWLEWYKNNMLRLPGGSLVTFLGVEGRAFEDWYWVRFGLVEGLILVYPGIHLRRITKRMRERNEED